METEERTQRQRTSKTRVTKAKKAS